VAFSAGGDGGSGLLEHCWRFRCQVGVSQGG